MDGRQYETPGRFARAGEKALREDAKRPRPLISPLCGTDCALPAGHVQRAGTPHVPAPWRTPPRRLRVVR